MAFANREDLDGRFVDTTREGFRTALDISAYTLVAAAEKSRTPHGRKKWVHRDTLVLRRREGRTQLQCYGRGQSGPRGKC